MCKCLRKAVQLEKARRAAGHPVEDVLHPWTALQGAFLRRCRLERALLRDPLVLGCGSCRHPFCARDDEEWLSLLEEVELRETMLQEEHQEEVEKQVIDFADKVPKRMKDLEGLSLPL